VNMDNTMTQRVVHANTLLRPELEQYVLSRGNAQWIVPLSPCTRSRQEIDKLKAQKGFPEDMRHEGVIAVVQKLSFHVIINIHYGAKPAFNPNKGNITLPTPQEFTHWKYFYFSMLHELSHATAEVQGRYLGVRYNDYYYCRDEILAEYSAILCSMAVGLLDVEILELSQCYIKLWAQSFFRVHSDVGLRNDLNLNNGQMNTSHWNTLQTILNESMETANIILKGEKES
jgi:hypothetical protein